jgi:hypothetical protein
MGVAILLAAGACTEDDGGVIAGGDQPGAATSRPTTDDPEPSPLAGADTTPVSVPGTAQGLLTDVRVARQDGFDRVVFEFDGGMPGYRVAYTERPVLEDGSGDEVEVSGAAVLEVRMEPAAGFKMVGEHPERTYKGPDRVRGDTEVVREAVRVGDFEALLTWAVGLDAEVPFLVTTLDSPDRLVIDFDDG